MKAPPQTPNEIRDAIEAAGLTVRALAQRAGVTERTVYNYLRGATSNPDTGAKLAKALRTRAAAAQ